jgi:chitinase
MVLRCASTGRHSGGSGPQAADTLIVIASRKPNVKIRPAAIALLLVSFAGLASANDTVFAGGFDPVWVLGYHVGYEADDYPTDKVDFAAMSHVIIGVVTPNADGSLNTTFDIDTVNGPIWAKGVATAAHAAGRKALLMIGGSGSSTGFEGAAGNSNRSTFVTHLLAAMDAAGADGLDLDWEPLDPVDYTIFTALAQGLRNARPALLLTAPVYAININLATAPDPFFGTIAPLFDRIDVMTYDMEWPADGWKSWFTSALYGETATTPMSVDSSVSFYLSSGVPRSKLGVGIGFYGVCWHGVTGPRQTIGKNAGIYGSDNTYSYHNIVTGYYSLANYYYDLPAQASYLANASAFGPGNGCNFLSYEDEQSIAAKGDYVRRNGLAGTIIWNIGEGYVPEDVGHENALLDAVNAAFQPGE